MLERVSISQFSTSRWSLDQDAASYASLGFGGIGVWRDKLDDYGEDEAADLLYEFGLRVSSLSWAGGFTGSDGRSFCESIDDALQAIRTAARLGARCLVVYPGARNGHTFKHARRLLRHALDCLVPVAEDFGVCLALEPMCVTCGAPWTFLSGWQEALDEADRYSPGSIGLVLDLYHVGYDRRLLAQLAPLLSRIVLVQLADRLDDSGDEPNRRLLGSGCLPIGSWIRQLLKVGYRGAFEVELYGPDVEHLAYAEVLEQTLDHVQRELSLAEAARGPA